MRRHNKRGKRHGAGRIGKGANPCAYCHYHKATLTVRQMRNHKCLERGCQRLTKYQNHGFWLDRERIKAKKKERKTEKKAGKM